MARRFLPVLLGVLFVAACGGSDDGADYTAEPAGTIYFSTDRDGNDEIYALNPADPAAATNLTSDPSLDYSPRVSPDGDQLAFASMRKGNLTLWRMGVDGADPTQVTSGATSDSGPVWSPDQTQLAFFSSRDETRGLLWFQQIGGGDPLPLLDGITPPAADTPCSGGRPGAWTAEGEIIYAGNQADISAGQICKIAVNGGSIAPIYSKEDIVAQEPAISPDGTRLAFSANDVGNFEIYTMKTDGSDIKRLTTDPGNDLQPAWSPDGQWLAFGSNRDGDFELYIIRPDGTDLRRLTDNSERDGEPTWGP